MDPSRGAEKTDAILPTPCVQRVKIKFKNYGAPVETGKE